MLTHFLIYIYIEAVIKLIHLIFTDWVCGGEWNHLVNYLTRFISCLQNANINLVVFFNGCAEPQRMTEWIDEQQVTQQRVKRVIIMAFNVNVAYVYEQCL